MPSLRDSLLLAGPILSFKALTKASRPQIQLTLEQDGLNCAAPPVQKFLKINAHTVFSPWLGVQVWRADCMHPSALFYIGNLSVAGVGGGMRVLEPTLLLGPSFRYQG